MNNLSSVSIESVLNHLNIKYKPRKKEELAICCLFHKEKIPSMHINTKKNVFNCKSCNKSGNTYDLVKEYLNLDSKDTFKWFSDKGMNIENSTPKPTYTTTSTTIEKIINSTQPLKNSTKYLKEDRLITIEDYSYSGIKIALTSLNIDNISIPQDTLIIPMYDNLNHDNVVNLQLIYKDNTKLFLPKHTTKNLVLKLVMNPLEHRYYLVEGLVDGLSLNSAGYNAIVSFSLNNLVDSMYTNFYHELLQDRRIIHFSDSRFSLSDNFISKESSEWKTTEKLKLLGINSIVIEEKDITDVNDLLKARGIKGIKEFLKQDYNTIKHTLKSMIEKKQFTLFTTTSLSKGITYNFASKSVAITPLNSVEELHNTELAYNIKCLEHLDPKVVKNILVDLRKEKAIKHVASKTYDPTRPYLDIIQEKNSKELKVNVYQDTELMLKVKKQLDKTKINEYVKGFPNIAKLIKNLVDYDKVSEKWLYQFLAFKLQRPTTVDRNILVFYGRQKTGKNFFANILYALLDNNVDPCIETDELLNSKFTDKICNKLFNFVNEVSDREKEPLMNKLKSLSGNNSIKYEKKGEPAVIYPAYATYVLLTNKEHIVNLDVIDTRFTFFKSTKELDKDIALNIPKDSKELERELANFYAFLLSYDLGNITSIEPLNNQARLDAVENSKSSVELLIEKIANNELDTIISEHNSKHKTELPYYVKEQLIHATSIYYYVKKEDYIEVDTSIIEKLIRNTDKYISLKQIHNLGKEVRIDGKQVYDYSASSIKCYRSSTRRYVKILINTDTSEEV